MNMLNQIIIEGKLVKDCEKNEMTNTISFPIAVNGTYRNSNGETVEKVSYFDIEAYGILGEYVSMYGKKGRTVRIVGRIKQSRWKDGDGKNCSRVFVIAEHIEFKPMEEK